MAETVGQHSVAAFTSPVNGTSPIDANTVKGNDNTIRSAYVDHDADPGIHVQSSTLASRPTANSAGRKWMTQDSGVIRLFYDDGTSWYEIDYLRTTGGTISGNLAITGTLSVTGVATLTAQPILSSLTASQAVFTDASKGLVSNAITGTGNVVMSASPTLTGTITAAAATLSGALGVSGLLTFASLKGTGATTVTNILDEDNMASDSATALATQQSIKAYVDAQVGASDALSEVLAIGNTTGANDIIVSAGQKIRTPAVAAQDGSSAITIANTTGALTLATALADSNLATISTAGKVANSATTATDANTASAIVARDSSGNFSAGTITAALSGNASTATALQTARTINGVSFDGTANITVTAAAGTLTGSTLASGVTASSLTSVGTLANLTVTNPITGSVTGSSGSTTGNAATATALQTARTINGVSFDGTANITVTADAGTLTGSTLASGVTASSLTSVGTLSSLTVSGNVTVDTNTLFVDATNNAVGIGTTTPNTFAKLATVAASTANALYAGTGTQGLFVSASDATRFVTYASSGSLIGGHRWLYGNTEGMSLDASGNLAVDTNTLYVDATNNRVGIGTASPATGLHLLGVASANTDFTHETVSAGTAARTRYLRGGSVKFLAGLGAYTGGDTYEIAGPSAAFATIDASGNLGLGVTPSAFSTGRAIQVGATNGLTLFGFANGAELGNNFYFDSAYKYTANGTATRYTMGSGLHIWYTAASGTAGNAITFTQAMTLDASGNLLVNRTSAYRGGKLVVAGTNFTQTSNNGNVQFLTTDTQAANVGASLGLGGQVGGDEAAFGYISGRKENSTSGNYAGYLAFATLDGGAACAERARITSAGGFSVGTTTDLGAGNIAIAAGKYLGYSASAYMTPEDNVQGARIKTPGGIVFEAGGSERARITSGGYFKASNDGTYAGSTASYHELRSSGPTSDWTVHVSNTNATAGSLYGTIINYSNASPNGGGNEFLYCVDSTAARATIRSNGGIANYQGNDVNLSDERVKTDIQPVGSYWDKLKAIEIVTFKYKDQTHDDDNIGVIAQQVEAVAPEFIDVDGFGETPEGEEPLKAVYTTDLYHAAIKALQEAMARIESLEARLAALES